MKKVLIIQNETREGPGIIKTVLDQQGIPLHIVNAHLKQRIPTTKGYGALFVLSGLNSANSASERMAVQKERIAECLERNIPYFGVCLGMHLLSSVMGLSVVESPRHEIGLRDKDGRNYVVELTSAGKADPLFKGIAESSLPVFQLHAESVVLPKEDERFTLLATGACGENQIIKFGHSQYGALGHFEFTKDIVRALLKEDPDIQQDNEKKIEEDFGEIYHAYFLNAVRIFKNFLNIAGY